MATGTCPLSPTDCARLREMLSSCDITDDMLDKLERVGMPVDEPRAANRQQREFAQRVKAEFFPGEP